MAPSSASTVSQVWPPCFRHHGQRCLLDRPLWRLAWRPFSRKWQECRSTTTSSPPNLMTPRGNCVISKRSQPNCRTVWNEPCIFGRKSQLRAYNDLALKITGSSRPQTNQLPPEDCLYPPPRSTIQNIEFTPIVAIESTIGARSGSPHPSRSEQNSAIGS
ncbi:hypothetical protein ACE6H2_002176 [Prunus campanulata]